MFVDFPEVVIIFGVALVALGPKKLPGVAAEVGRWVGRARGMARQFREQLEQEVGTVQNALDTNVKRDSNGSTPAASDASSATNPEAGDEQGTESSTADGEPMSWHPEYELDASLAPYGDPNAIPETNAAAYGQLSLELEPPGEQLRYAAHPDAPQQPELHLAPGADEAEDR